MLCQKTVYLLISGGFREEKDVTHVQGDEVSAVCLSGVQRGHIHDSPGLPGICHRGNATT